MQAGAQGWVLSVDFGTSYSMAAITDSAGEVRLLEVDHVRSVPSGVWVDDAGQLVVGVSALRQAALAPQRWERAPKRLLGESMPLMLGGTEVPVVAAVAEVIKHLAQEAVRQQGSMPAEVRLTHPARWGDRRKGALRAAAQLAGLGAPPLPGPPLLVEEPVAAAMFFAHQDRPPVGARVAVFDLGGGTLDTAVLEATGDGFAICSSGGIDGIGGERFDDLLYHLVGEHLARRDPTVWQRLQAPPDDRWSRAGQRLFREVRRAKEDLSGYPSVALDTGELIDIPVTLTRDELEQVLASEIERSVDVLGSTIAQVGAGFAATDLHRVYLAGGSSRIPAVARTIEQRLGIAPTALGEPKAVVVAGAAHPSVGGLDQELERRKREQVVIQDRERERAEREQAEREQAEREQAEREQAERENSDHQDTVLNPTVPTGTPGADALTEQNVPTGPTWPHDPLGPTGPTTPTGPNAPNTPTGPTWPPPPPPLPWWRSPPAVIGAATVTVAVLAIALIGALTSGADDSGDTGTGDGTTSAPGPITALKLDPADGPDIKLDWADVSAAVHYQVVRDAGTGQETTAFTTTSDYVDSPGDNAGHTYRVNAVGLGDIAGPASSELTARAEPGAPDNLSAAQQALVNQLPLSAVEIASCTAYPDGEGTVGDGMALAAVSCTNTADQAGDNPGTQIRAFKYDAPATLEFDVKGLTDSNNLPSRECTSKVAASSWELDKVDQGALLCYNSSAAGKGAVIAWGYRSESILIQAFCADPDIEEAMRWWESAASLSLR